MLIVATAVLLPLLLLIVVVEVRLWGGYFEGLFPEDIEVPVLGVVSAGVLTALMPGAAGFLLGWFFEALVGAFPLPILGRAASAWGRRWRGVFALVLALLSMVLASTVFDAANEVYDGLGQSTCALRAASETDALATDAAPVLQPDSATDQAACIADWKADDRARSIRVVLGELALTPSGLFAWSILSAATLLMLLVLCVPVTGLWLLAGVGWAADPTRGDRPIRWRVFDTRPGRGRCSRI
jgi:hypothetical protein